MNCYSDTTCIRYSPSVRDSRKAPPRARGALAAESWTPETTHHHCAHRLRDAPRRKLEKRVFVPDRLDVKLRPPDVRAEE